MVIFGTHEFREKTSDVLNRIKNDAQLILKESYDHNKAVKLLIDYGEFETAVADFYLKDSLEMIPIISLLRKAGKITGDIFSKSYEKNFEVVISDKEFIKILERIRKYPLPEEIRTKIPEGYAYYGLYPEMYFEAAKKFFSEHKPQKAFVIGIRSIGTSLSSVVSSALSGLNVSVISFTIRPYGHPFNRRTQIDNEAVQLISKNKDSHFIIVDEGPGLSGSSFYSVAEALINLNVDKNKIIFFPSRSTNGNELLSEKAKCAWNDFKKYFISFDDLWSSSGRFDAISNGYNFNEISAGEWRNVLIKNKKRTPPVYPRFERRKFILKNDKGKILYFVKFGGLGKYGEKVFNRSQKFTEAGFSPEVYKFDHGFIFYKYIEPRKKTLPFDMGKFLTYVIDYLLFIERNFPAGPSNSFGDVKEMIYNNINEIMGSDYAEKAMRLKFDKKLFSSAVENDGRMLPHEWIFNGRYYKTDNAEHYFDHLFPGCQDIAWDIAGFFTEFNLSKEQREYFINEFSSLSKNKHIRKKIKFYLIEYLAFRLGYCSFACQNSSDPADKRKFSTLKNAYADLLKYELVSQ